MTRVLYCGMADLLPAATLLLFPQVALDAQFLDLAGDRIAAHAQKGSRFDAPAARAREGAQNQRALGLASELIQDSGLAAAQALLDFALQCRDPVRRRDRGRRATKLGRQVGHADDLSGSHYVEPVTQIFQLAHVAREI